jgi:hypothetical protein
MKIIAGLVLLVTLMMSQCGGNEPSVEAVPTDSLETVDTTFTPTVVDSVDVSVPTDSTVTVE